jgi:putative 4-mercaptohistidine N1-methyltranferase
MNNNIYETNKSLCEYCDFHYGDEYFGVKNFAKNSIEILKPFIKNRNRVLDLGCAVGRSSFELANYFNEVVAIDYSNSFINLAKKIQNSISIKYDITIEGDLKEQKIINLEELDLYKNRNKIEFLQGDATNLDSKIKNFDLIFCSNLIDRLNNPMNFIENISSRLNKNGVLVILSPYTWLEEYTNKNNWLGGYEKNNKEIFTIDTLKNNLVSMDLIKTYDVEFVIKETKRKFQHTISQMSIWNKI